MPDDADDLRTLGALAARATLAVAKATTTTQAWRALHRIAFGGERALRTAFLRAVTAVQTATPMTAVAAALRRGDLDAAANAIPWNEVADPALRESFGEALRTTYERAGAKALELQSFPSDFVIVDPRAAEWLATASASKVVEVSDGTRAGIRAALDEAMRSGLSATRAARLVRPQIGLFDRWARAVTRYGANLEASGRYAPEDVDTRVERYATQLRQARALMIARTEADDAVTQGQRAAWEQAANNGDFERAEAVREWVASPGACEQICQLLDGTLVAYDEPFLDPDSGEPCEPGTVHPNCRCGEYLWPRGKDAE